MFQNAVKKNTEILKFLENKKNASPNEQINDDNAFGAIVILVMKLKR